MDIAKVQKLNNLAVELKRHNLVFNKEDALSHAERIYGNENNFSTEFADEEHFDDSAELKKDVRKLTFALKDAILEIKDLKLKVGKLEREINDVRVNAKPVYVERPVQREEPQTQLVQEKKKEEKVELAVSREKFKNDDFSIEKYFYFGQK
ncbi:TPA: hypothetical protein HA239_02740 [Candidatus Woesearchaeota archaeon]|nr:hypothetical protein QT06_C0001G1148 [archaeon GW2011_AR15]MBS3104381.1 hypothetical protein [Candidatus Woesearchaeota archaeon]HIH41306.1 hypothetical protein [Candidatus Woesearchaeota archaeon]